MDNEASDKLWSCFAASEKSLDHQPKRDKYQTMVIDKFYFRDTAKGDVMIGVLPERRTMPQRITQESVTNWVRKTPFSTEVDFNNVYFVPITVKGLYKV
jgi:hypothetical protein